MDSFRLYRVPALQASPLALNSAYTILHLVSSSCYEAAAAVESMYDAEKSALQGTTQLIHVFVGAEPYPFGAWLEGLKSQWKAAWVGPTSAVVAGVRVDTFPSFLLLEGKRVIYSGEKLDPPLATLAERCIAQNLAALATSAVSLNPRDASSAVICASVLADVLRTLPLPEPVDVFAEQQRIIESLRLEVLQREKELQELRQYAPVPKTLSSPRLLPPLSTRPVVPLAKSSEPTDFWKSLEDDESPSPELQQSQFKELAGSHGLWITKAEQPARDLHLQSEVNPATLLPRKTIGVEENEQFSPGKSTFFEQRQRHNMLLAKQPLGRDGRPLPAVRSVKKLTPRAHPCLSLGEAITSPRHKG